MLGTELALAKAFVDAFALTDVYDEADAFARVAQILGTLETPEQAQLVGPAYSRAVRLLDADLPRCRAAADVAVRLDIVEALEGLLETLRSHADVHQLSNAASLASSAAAPAGAAQDVWRIAEGANLADAFMRQLTLRLSATSEPDSDLEVVVAAQAWPGRANREALRRIGPSVYVDGDADRALDVWKTVAILASSGARVRRLPPVGVPVDPAWFQPLFPLVTWSGLGVTRIKRALPLINPRVITPPEDLSSVISVTRFLNRLRRELPAWSQLRMPPEVSPAELPAFSPESLSLGGFDAAEMSYLGAASLSVVRRLAQESLRPYDSDVQRWQFSKLVTLRIVQAFKGRGLVLKTDPAGIHSQLEELAAASETSRVGVDAKGVIFVEEGGIFTALHSGQQAIPEAVLIDQAFQGFRLGGGAVPNLLQPGRYTTVHPAVLGGAPVVQNRRLSARALAQLMNTRGEAVLRSAYPELSMPEIGDAVRVGRGILSART
jgi:uncharacterized protein (DUF433 family)